jgi:hypothetical protein
MGRAKGSHHDVAPSPGAIAAAPSRTVKALHQRDLHRGYGDVYLPFALERNIWQRPRNGAGSTFFLPTGCRRIREAAPCAGITWTRTRCNGRETRREAGGFDQACQLPHAAPQFCDPPVAGGYDIRTLQELLGHRDVSTTMIYTHVVNQGAKAFAALWTICM